MTIKGLKRNERSVPRAGIIRLGYKTRYCQNPQCNHKLAWNDSDTTTCPRCKGEMSKQTTAESSHFILKDAPGVAEALKTDCPTELKVFFPFDDIDKNFPDFRKLYSATSLVCKGDGEYILDAMNPQTGQATVKDGVCIRSFSERMADGKQVTHNVGDKMPCPAWGEPGIYAKCEHCQPRGILLVMLKEVPRMAYFQISTGSIVNLQELPQQMLNVQEIVYELTGRRKLAGIPFILRRVVRSMSPQKKDRQGNPTGRVRVNKYVLQLEIEPEYMLKLVRAQRRLVDPLAAYALPSGQPADHGNDIVGASIVIEPPQEEPYPIEEEAETVWWEEPEEPTRPAQPEPQPAPVQPAAPTNGGNGHSKLTRPMSPEQVKTAAAVKSLKSTKPASETQLDFAASSLSKALDGDDDKRYLVTEFLFGFTSLKNATAGQCSFIIDWIGAKKENEYTPSEDALKEIDLILRQVQIERGQIDMFNQPSELEEFLGRETKEIDF